VPLTILECKLETHRQTDCTNIRKDTKCVKGIRKERWDCMTKRDGRKNRATDGRTRVTPRLRTVGKWSKVTHTDSYFRHVAPCWEFVHKMADSAGWRIEQFCMYLPILMGRSCWAQGGETFTRFWWERLKGREQFEGLGVNARIILKVDHKQMGGRKWSGLIWLTVGRSGWLLWTW